MGVPLRSIEEVYTPGEYVGQDVFFFTVSVLVLILTPVLLAASELLPPNINIAANKSSNYAYHNYQFLKWNYHNPG